MDDDLTASHWDDVLPTTQTNLSASNVGSIFNSLNLEDPHRDPDQFDGVDEERSDASDGHTGESQENDSYVAEIQSDFFDNALNSSQSPFQASTNFNQSELDELNAIKKQERDTHKSSLISKLTNGDEDLNIGELAIPSAKLSASESLFEDRDSPIKIQPLIDSTSQVSSRYPISDSVVSPTKSQKLKQSQFKAPRSRRIPSKTVIKHLSDAQPDDFDPLSSVASLQDQSSTTSESVKNKTKQLYKAVDQPLYEISKTTPSNPSTTSQISKFAQPKSDSKSDTVEPRSNDLMISVGDPAKIGDITTAHIVYEVKTQNKNKESQFFPTTEEPTLVSRRYKDFRWVYHQLQNNHPGKIIPPPPSKQTYIGRFNENFIENRRLSLEKMLDKISKIPSLANDTDFILFLTSSNFANDAKERDQVSGSGASIQASDEDDENDKSSISSVTGTVAGGFMSSLFSMAVKYPEPDEYFSKKKGYVDDLEHNLKTFYKSLELIASQRIEISSVIGEVANIVEELASLEISKTTTDILAAFAEVHYKLKENLDRVNLQDQLTLGFTIEEYLRIIGSVKYTFETRSKIYQQFQSFKQDLVKKEESLDRLNSRYKSSVDKINQVSFEVDKLRQKVSHYEESFNKISETIKTELDNFEIEKIEDFRNSVEIFIESSIESQKEAIELWETFYERQNLASV